jgi:hypothetical protein
MSVFPWRAAVAEQLGHSSPMLTLKTYAHAIHEEEMDLSFADFEVRDGSERLYPAPRSTTQAEQKNAPDLSGRGRSIYLEHETGLAGGLRPLSASRAKLSRDPNLGKEPPTTGGQSTPIWSGGGRKIPLETAPWRSRRVMRRRQITVPKRVLTLGQLGFTLSGSRSR